MRNSLFRKPAYREDGGLCPKEPSYLSYDSSVFYTKRKGIVVEFCKLFGAGILCSCSCPCNPGDTVPINLQ